MTETFNAQHQLGLDLSGNPGAAFFAELAPTVAEASTNSGGATATAVITDASGLQAADYKLQWTGATWQLTNETEVSTTAADGSFQVDGLIHIGRRNRCRGNR